MKPFGRFGPGERKRPMMPATKPITMIQIMFDTKISLCPLRLQSLGQHYCPAGRPIFSIFLGRAAGVTGFLLPEFPAQDRERAKR
jgi:hypothetical protein